MATVYIGLGSNLKDRLAFLIRAVGEMDKHFTFRVGDISLLSKCPFVDLVIKESEYLFQLLFIGRDDEFLRNR